MLGTVLGTWNIIVNKTDKVPALMQEVVRDNIKK